MEEGLKGNTSTCLQRLLPSEEITDDLKFLYHAFIFIIRKHSLKVFPLVF